MYSYFLLSYLTGKTRKQITEAVFKLQLPTVRRKGGKRVTEEVKNIIIDYFNKPAPLKRNPSKKISIIESYIQNQSIYGVAKTMRIRRDFVRETVNEWNENNEYIVVESSINNQKYETYKGVFKRGKTWSYDIRVNGKRFRGAGYKTEEEAFEAKIKCKKECQN